jgi:hypothetical protein
MTSEYKQQAVEAQEIPISIREHLTHNAQNTAEFCVDTVKTVI